MASGSAPHNSSGQAPPNYCALACLFVLLVGYSIGCRRRLGVELPLRYGALELGLGLLQPGGSDALRLGGGALRLGFGELHALQLGFDELKFGFEKFLLHLRGGRVGGNRLFPLGPGELVCVCACVCVRARACVCVAIVYVRVCVCACA